MGRIGQAVVSTLDHMDLFGWRSDCGRFPRPDPREQVHPFLHESPYSLKLLVKEEKADVSEDPQKKPLEEEDNLPPVLSTRDHPSEKEWPRSQRL